MITKEETVDMNKKKIALITGITGQDGGYLAEFLLKKGTKVKYSLRVQN